MRKTVQFFIFVMFLGIFSASCSRTDSNSQNTNQTANAAQTAENSNSTKDNAESLAMIVNLPFEPEDAVWREEKAANGKEGKLTAVLEFKPEDSTEIIYNSDLTKPPITAEIPVELWFPAELIAQGELSGDDTIKGNVYSAEQFTNSPYTDGRITQIHNSNYFVLELYSR